MKRFEMYWADFDVTIRAQLLEDDNPTNCAEFWRMLPFKAIFAASMSAGEMFKVPVPRSFSPQPPEKRVFLPQEPDGTIVAYGSSSLLIKYGVIAEPFLCPKLALINQTDLASFRHLAIALRDAYFFTKVIHIAQLRPV
ncbi:MAG: DUF3830 family protein [Dehalococcoidia bacterium]|nr:DUF3830 family protein [Dehalococcoidia bacterium]